jgi:hypothetical protein
MIKKFTFLMTVVVMSAGLLNAQTFTDGLMMNKSDLCTGFIYANDSWKKYWEGSLNRENGNIGTVSTKSIAWMGAYGITDKINVIAMVPYVWTNASQGTMSGMKGLQDLTVGAKYNFFKKAIASSELSTFVVGSFSTPLGNYTPDYLPLSIGLAAKKISGRFTSHYKLSSGWYATGNIGYTWRSNITLDRPAYYTDGQLTFSNEVWMPNVLDYSFNVGYLKNGLQAFVGYTQQNTLGGGDIRRQDMPFASNRMNFSKIDATVKYFIPKMNSLAVWAGIGYTLTGRNVGQSTYYMGGLLYTLHFAKTANQ